MPWFIGDRSEIDWSPTINPSKCVQCGMCMNCGKHVFAWTSKGAFVANPLACVVGCTTCRTLCKGNAISFPSVKKLRDAYEQRHMWDRVKEALVRAGKLGEREAGTREDHVGASGE